ncbi:MAG TPA: ABC transporter substrate-binding protein [Stellaceae bacterium]|nr:ABC transporter substrate-binding protein [Stellaceae bacterium]
MPATIRTLARALGVEPRGEVLAAYAEGVLAEVRTGVKSIPPADRLRAYYGRGKDGLTTAGPGSLGAEFMELLGLENVASEDAAQMYRVTPEQIRAWKPDLLIVLGHEAADAFRSDPLMQALAQHPHRFLVSPTLPFGWVDGPPSPSRLLALRWLGAALYPGRFPEDMRSATRGFYRLFYQVDLTDAQLDELLR